MKELLLYPLKFQPLYKQKIWGGEKLKTVLNKKNTPENAGESWEISAVQDNLSVVENGFLKGNTIQEIIEIYMGDLVGPDIYEKFGSEFPLLVKFIDANDKLSVQVHPDNDTAKKRHNAYGKNEMWYIVDAESEAKLVYGFNKQLSTEEFIARMNDNDIEDVLNFTPVKNDEVYFIPAGTVHATGKGILLAEIQQTSDITYRIYDWDREDKNGNKRDLHVDLARDVLNFNPPEKEKSEYKAAKNKPVRIASSEYFVTNLIDFNKPFIKSYADIKSFVIIICLKGQLKIEWTNDSIEMKTGETVLIPYELPELSFYPEKETKILETYIEK